MQMQQLIDQLSATYVERSETIEPLVAAVIARRHAVLIGPPGTAKSSLVRDLAAGLGGLRFFSWLLTEFSVPEELFGPLDISALEQGQYRRLTAGGSCATMSLTVASSTVVAVQAAWLLLCGLHVEFITLFNKTQPLPPGGRPRSRGQAWSDSVRTCKSDTPSPVVRACAVAPA